jgi:hypothetical protein
LLFLDIREQRASRTRADGATYDFTMRPWSPDELTSTLRRNGMRDIDITSGVGRRTPDRLFVIASG